MTWQTSAKVLTDIIDLIVVEEDKTFKEDYYGMTWELSVEEDGSFWLNA